MNMAPCTCGNDSAAPDAKHSWRRARWLLCVAVCSVLMFVILGAGPYSTPIQWVFSLIVGGDKTRYADTYSEWAWMQVTTQMHDSDVVKLIGRPLWFDVLSERDECWKYSRGVAPGDRFHIRSIVIRDHTVVAKTSKFSEWPY